MFEEILALLRYKREDMKIQTYISFIIFLTLSAFNAQAQVDKVVYQIDNTQVQGVKALRNIRNQLDIDPTTKISVVAYGDGVEFLMEGSKDQKSDTEYAPLISALKARGVQFEACEMTMKNKKLNKNQFIFCCINLDCSVMEKNTFIRHKRTYF